MNFLSTFILLTFTLTISFGYKSDCIEKTNKPCTIWMTLNENAFTKMFLPVLYPFDELSIEYIMDNETPGAQSNEKINKIIEKEVDENTIEKFVNLLGKFSYQQHTKVVVVEDINEGSGTLVTDVKAPEPPIQTDIEEFVPEAPTTEAPTTTTTRMRITRAPITYRPLAPINKAGGNRGGIGYALMGK